MKQFIYLDTDIVNSIIAQSQKGIITGFSSEKSDTQTSTETDNIEGSIAGSIGGKILNFVKAESNLMVKDSLGNEKSTLGLTREIATKTLHDAAFDLALDILKNEIVKDEPDDIGSYIQTTKVFDFVDLEYIEGLFLEESLIDYLKKSSKEKIEVEAQNLTSGSNRDQLRKSGNNIRAEIKKIMMNSDKQYDSIKDIMMIIGKIIPYKRMLVSSDGFLIPLSDEYFRIDMKTLGFKYGGEITCIGMTTNIIGEDANPHDASNIFATLQHSVNEILRILLPTKEKNLWIIHPIAIYYGK